MELSKLVNKSRDRVVLSEAYADYHKRHQHDDSTTCGSDNPDEVKPAGTTSMLHEMLDSFLSRESLFKDKNVLQSGYCPDVLLHREAELVQLAKILAPLLRGEQVSNVFIYGKTGVGKTLTVRHVCNELELAAKRADVKTPLKFIYINAKLRKVADTENRLISKMCEEMGLTNLPKTGLATSRIYDYFSEAADSKSQKIILIIDEVDRLINRAGDEVLYYITRMNAELKKSKLNVIGITNDLKLLDNIDPRVKSSLGEERLFFKPYNADQLFNILQMRADSAFREGVVGEGVIKLCAAHAAKEHGDARRALDLLRVAGEIAEREGALRLVEKQVEDAQTKIEQEAITEILKVQPQQSRAVLYSIIKLNEGERNKEGAGTDTGDVFSSYRQLCQRMTYKPLTQRRVSGLISELEVMGIIKSKVVSKGRGGRTREIVLAIDNEALNKAIAVLEEDFGY